MPLDEEPLHGPDGQRAIDVAAAAGTLARGGADVRAHRRDRVRIARQDVALLEPPLGGEVQVATAVRPDRTRFLALDVALEPGGVDGLDEEFLRRSGGQVQVVPSRWGWGSGASAERRLTSRVRIYHPPPAPCSAMSVRGPSGGVDGARSRSYAGRRGAPRRRRPWSWTCAQRERRRIRLPGHRPDPWARLRRRPRRGPSRSSPRPTRGPADRHARFGPPPAWRDPVPGSLHRGPHRRPARAGRSRTGHGHRRRRRASNGCSFTTTRVRPRSRPVVSADARRRRRRDAGTGPGDGRVPGRCRP